MRFWEIVDARNAVFDKTCLGKCVGSLSGGRVRDGSGYARIMVGSAPHWNCEFRLHFHTLHFQNLKEVSHENFVFTSFTFRFWRKSPTKASFSHLPLSLSEKSLPRQFRSHIFHCHFLREASHDSFVLSSSTFTLWWKSPTTASFLFLPLSDFEESLARKLCFHIFHFHSLREVSYEMRFWDIVDARTAVFCKTKRVLENVWGSLSGGRGARRSRLCADHGRIGPALELRVQASFSQFALSKSEGSLARKLRLHIFHFHFLLLRFWCCQLRKLGKSRRIASTSSSSKLRKASQN